MPHRRMCLCAQELRIRILSGTIELAVADVDPFHRGRVRKGTPRRVCTATVQAPVLPVQCIPERHRCLGSTRQSETATSLGDRIFQRNFVPVVHHGASHGALRTRRMGRRVQHCIQPLLRLMSLANQRSPRSEGAREGGGLARGAFEHEAVPRRRRCRARDGDALSPFLARRGRGLGRDRRTPPSPDPPVNKPRPQTLVLGARQVELRHLTCRQVCCGASDPVRWASA